MSKTKRRTKADFRGRAMAWLFLVCALLGCLLALTLRPAFYGGFEAVPRALNGDLEGLRSYAFTEREIAHMADVAHLYLLAKIVLCVGAVLFLALAVWTYCKPQHKKSVAKGALLGVADAFVLMGAIVLWAVIDFRSAFWAFHHIAFTNDLWLLDPNDLLIRMMPQAFFEHAARQIALCWAGCAAIWCVGWGIVRMRTKQERN
ncbi:MAG: DUF1461 domain-containing protein [Clostridia bacterium]|nr:DUF1461 domain-containing protein [Clostridia bacterium]